MKIVAHLLICLSILMSTNTYTSEETAALSSYFGSIWGYVSSYWNSLSDWIASWKDQRTAAQKASDNATNETRFDNETESADALITHAEELHQQVRAIKQAKTPLDAMLRKKIENYIATLEARRIDLSLLQARLSPNFVKEAAEGIITNFKGIKNFNPLDVYPFLAKQFAQQGIITIATPSNEQAKGKSFTQTEKVQKIDPVKQAGEKIRATFTAQKIATQINTLLKDLNKQKNPQNIADASLLRQVLFLFQTSKAKEQFDAFLLGDKAGGLFSLQIIDVDGSKGQNILDLIDRLQMIKAELQNDLR